MKSSKLLVPVVLSFIALIWIINGSIEFLEYRFKENGVPVTATFVGDERYPDRVKENESMNARPNYYIVSYSYKGKEYEATLRGVNDDDDVLTEEGESPSPGAEIAAIVDPENPNRIYAKEDSSNWTGTIVISFIMLGILGMERLFREDK